MLITISKWAPFIQLSIKRQRDQYQFQICFQSHSSSVIFFYFKSVDEEKIKIKKANSRKNNMPCTEKRIDLLQTLFFLNDSEINFYGRKIIRFATSKTPSSSLGFPLCGHWFSLFDIFFITIVIDWWLQ